MSIAMHLLILRGSALLLALITASAFAEDAAVQKPPATNVGGIDEKDGGTITGIIKFKGEKPTVKQIVEVAGNAYCKQHHEKELPIHETFLTGKNGEDETLQYVLVYVSKGLEGKEFSAPKQSVVLDQVGCIYRPHVISATVGQAVEIKNSDGTLHNVMCTPQNNSPFNIGTSQGDAIKRTFKEAEFKVKLRCVMHPWMMAYVHVLDHPFHAVTQSDGTFTLKGLPPGDYELSVMHELSAIGATPEMMSVKIAAGETKKVEFVYEMKK
jgi:plastocyanin